MVRSDARENRDRLLAVARRAFKESGDVSMNQIARLANVGAGTLYRNFPNRDALVLAIYADEAAQLIDSVPSLLERSSPFDALRSWTIDLVEAMRRKHGLGDALNSPAHQAAYEQHWGPVVAAITQIFDAGKRDGSIRQDAEPADFLMLTGSLWRAAGNAHAQPERMLDLILDGLRAR